MRNDIQNIEDQKIKNKGSRPFTILTVVFVLTWAALIWFGWNAWSSYHKTKTEKEYHSKTEKLLGTIIHLDEVLTMSARMAAATGDLQWEKRYRSFEPKLDAAIKEAMRLAPEAYSGKAASDTDTANIRLVDMENQSFDLIRQGRIEEAKALLFSDEYEEQKRIYAQGMTNFAAGLSVIARTNLQDEQRQTFLRVGIVLLLILLLIIVWFVAFRVVRSWEETLISKKELEEEIAERKKAEEQVKASLKEKEVLLQEIHHRVKNNMQVIISLLRLQSDKVEDKKYADMFKEGEDRIRSMALIHEQLYQTKDFANVDFGEYIKSLTNGLFTSHGVDPNKIKLNIENKDIRLDLENAIPCGLIINELVSNSLKHAFPHQKEGNIGIILQSVNEDEFELTVSDDGVGISEDLGIEQTDTMGLHLIKVIAEQQLDGKIEVDRTEGTQFNIKFKRTAYKPRI